jgi:hypothetical protein
MDIFQRIVGFVDFRDIFHLLCTAKLWVMAPFIFINSQKEEAIYSGQLTCALEHERQAVKRILWKTKEHPGTTWHLHDMLEAFIDQHCEACNIASNPRILILSVESTVISCIGLPCRLHVSAEHATTVQDDNRYKEFDLRTSMERNSLAKQGKFSWSK